MAAKKTSKAKAPAKPTMAQAFKSASKTVAKSGKPKSSPSSLPIPQPIPGERENGSEIGATGQLLRGPVSLSMPKNVPDGYQVLVFLSDPPKYKLVKKQPSSRRALPDPGLAPRLNKDDKSVPMPTVPPQQPRKKTGKRRPGDGNL